MNLAKEAALQSEDIRDYAEDVATVAGVGRRCEMHEVFIGEFTDEDQLRAAYKIANWRIIKGAIKLPPSMSPRDFIDLVKEVVKSAPASCPKCGPIFGKVTDVQCSTLSRRAAPLHTIRRPVANRRLDFCEDLHPPAGPDEAGSPGTEGGLVAFAAEVGR